MPGALAREDLHILKALQPKDVAQCLATVLPVVQLPLLSGHMIRFYFVMQ